MVLAGDASAGSRSGPRALWTRLETPWGSALAVFLLAAAVTLLTSLLAPASVRIESSDYLVYYEPVARDLLAGKGFVDHLGEPAVYYPPGLPVTLAGIFGLAAVLGISEATVFFLFTILCMGLSSVFVYFIARSVWGATPAFLAPLVWVSYPFVQFFTLQHSKEVVFMTLFYGATLLLWQALRRESAPLRRYFLAGLLIGLGMLFVPGAIGAAVVMGAAVWWIGRNRPVRSRVLWIATLLLGNLVAIGPWEAWAYSATGRVVPLSTVGPNSVVNGYTYAVRPTPYRQASDLPPDVLALMREVHEREHEMKSLGGVVTVLAQELRARPLAMTKLVGIKIARSWYGTDSQRLDRTISIVQIPYVLLILAATWFAWRRGGTSRQLAVVVWFLTLYFWGVTTLLALSLLRYMVPAVGLLFVLVPAVVPQNRRP